MKYLLFFIQSLWLQQESHRLSLEELEEKIKIPSTQTNNIPDSDAIEGRDSRKRGTSDNLTPYHFAKTIFSMLYSLGFSTLLLVNYFLWRRNSFFFPSIPLVKNFLRYPLRLVTEITEMLRNADLAWLVISCYKELGLMSWTRARWYIFFRLCLYLLITAEVCSSISRFDCEFTELIQTKKLNKYFHSNWT